MASEYIEPFRIFAMYDGEKRSKAPFEIKEEQQDELQNKGYGIFWVVNNIEGARTAENCKKINYWFCDIDSKIAGSKEKMLDDLSKSRVKPTHIIETKNGFHCYWRAKNATVENWKKIEEGLVKKFNADPARTDLCGLLRKPYSAHLKDYENKEKISEYTPFCIRYLDDSSVWLEYLNVDNAHKLTAHSNKEYDEETMLNYFEVEKPKTVVQKTKIFDSSKKKDYLDENNWEKLFKISNIVKGCRNSYLYWIINRLKDNNCTESEICFVIEGINKKLADPLSEQEINSLLRRK